jgi:hypothetical protein
MIRKVGLIILFGAGIFTMVAAILRVHFVVEVGSTHAYSICLIEADYYRNMRARKRPFGHAAKTWLQS